MKCTMTMAFEVFVVAFNIRFHDYILPALQRKPSHFEKSYAVITLTIWLYGVHVLPEGISLDLESFTISF
ncbi:MAG: hypothetical protein V7776_08195 [Halopseudomonas aestusnigri]